MPPIRLAYLFQRYFEKTATDAERAEFMSLLQDPASEAGIKALMEGAWQQLPENGTLPGELPHFTAAQSRDLLKNILGRQEASGSRKPSYAPDPASSLTPRRSLGSQGSPAVSSTPVRRITWGRAVAASLLFLMLCGGAAWWLSKPAVHPDLARTAKPAKTWPQDVVPGGNKAMLILDDGSRIVLDSAREGALASQGNAQVLKLSGGRLAYRIQNNRAQQKQGSQGTDPDAAKPVAYNMIATPMGGQYQVILPDGTKAWLNAASTLRFPTAFTGKEREVELTGEGYFEVAKDKARPFRVSVAPPAGGTGPGTKIEVLGTHFNVMAYKEENFINTSLLEGSVRVTEGARSGLLKPGQQASCSRESEDLAIGEADMEQAVAWKNGLFQFEGATIGTVMRQVARWYNVQVQYKGNIPRHFSGVISRSVTLSQVLTMLEMAGKVKFQLEGNTVSVIPV